jgi:hypothetical protein
MVLTNGGEEQVFMELANKIEIVPNLVETNL